MVEFVGVEDDFPSPGVEPKFHVRKGCGRKSVLGHVSLAPWLQPGEKGARELANRFNGFPQWVQSR